MVFRRTVEFWFYFFRLIILVFVLSALVWANIVEEYYKDLVVFGIMIFCGAYIVYLILNNILFLFSKKNSSNRHKGG
jgi:hypothetical protein